MPRLGGFPQDRSVDLDVLFESMTSTSGAEVVQTSLPLEPEREALSVIQITYDLPLDVEKILTIGAPAGRFQGGLVETCLDITTRTRCRVFRCQVG